MRYDEPTIYGVDASGNKKAIKVETDGTINVKNSATSGGDASAAKQDQQTAILQTLLTEGTAATGVTGPTGGSGAFKWFSGIWDLANSIKALLPSALVGDRFKVDGSGVTQPVSAASLPLPTGAATSANQTTANTSLSSIDGKLPSVLASDRLKVDGSGVTQPISAASLPLPSGAATSANQTTANTSLSSIDTKTPALGQALAAASTPVVLPSAQLSAIASETTLGKLIWTSTAITSASASYSSQNASEKTWTIPAGFEWQITEFYADLVSNATVGNRQLAIRILDASDNPYSRLPVGVTQAASLTRRYSWGVGLPDFTSFRDTDKLETPLPPLILPAGFKIKILDTAAIDTTNDSLTVRGLILQRTV